MLRNEEDRTSFLVKSKENNRGASNRERCYGRLVRVSLTLTSNLYDRARASLARASIPDVHLDDPSLTDIAAQESEDQRRDAAVKQAANRRATVRKM